MPRASTDPATSLRMSRQRRRDTGAEMALRRALHARGLRYRIDQPLPGLPRCRADITFTKQRVIVFVDGCFWHGCREHKSLPTANRDWWAAKLRGNIERDELANAHLARLGWTVIRVWEHEDPQLAAGQIEAAVRTPRDPEA